MINPKDLFKFKAHVRFVQGVGWVESKVSKEMIPDMAAELFEQWKCGNKTAVMLHLEDILGLLRCAVVVQLTLLILDWDKSLGHDNKLPEFVEYLEQCSFDRSELEVGKVMES